MSATAQSAIAVIGIDIGKNSFHIVGLDGRGAIVLRQKWSRGYSTLEATRAHAAQIATDLAKEPSYEGFVVLVTDEHRNEVAYVPVGASGGYRAEIAPATSCRRRLFRSGGARREHRLAL